jgi:hypothetical protein
MRIIIAGGRKFRNYALLEQVMKEYEDTISEVVCGCADGADSLGELWGRKHGVPISYFPAQWEKYGNAAGPIRNAEMAEYGDFLVAFWDGQSRGTANMIQAMKNLGKHGKVVRY